MWRGCGGTYIRARARMCSVSTERVRCTGAMNVRRGSHSSAKEIRDDYTPINLIALLRLFGFPG